MTHGVRGLDHLGESLPACVPLRSINSQRRTLPRGGLGRRTRSTKSTDAAFIGTCRSGNSQESVGGGVCHQIQ